MKKEMIYTDLFFAPILQMVHWHNQKSVGYGDGKL